MIELLIAVAIIAVLASLIVPATQVVMEKARRSMCASNLRQCGAGLFAYAAENEEWLPKGRSAGIVDPDVYLEGASHELSLAVQLKPYLRDLKAWRCPATKSAPIDDAKNTATDLRSSLVYWPYLSYGTTPSAFKSLGNTADHGSQTALMQDECYTFGGAWRANHSRGGMQTVPFASNPSLAMTFSGVPRGLNILYGDCHVTWTPYDTQQVVVVFKPGPSSVYSSKLLLK
jgi:type II secretory pathway pseudopilin PulG